MRTRGFAVARRARVGLAFLLALAAASCGDKGPRYPVCGSDKDCRAREHCVNRTCQQCAIDTHCRANESCIDGACVAPPGSCSADADCRGGAPCVQGRCRPCSEDRECGASRKCRAGRCLARGKCAKDTACADDEDCLSGSCQRPGRSRPPNVSCKLEPVFFGFDETGLRPDARTILARVGDCVQSVPGRGVVLFGHTDQLGTEEYNVALSERRARTVADYLARLGIDPARFRVVPRGETQASSTSETDRARDRRVEIEWQ
jgi:peptidoglycan-associated lipoprotein